MAVQLNHEYYCLGVSKPGSYRELWSGHLRNRPELRQGILVKMVWSHGLAEVKPLDKLEIQSGWSMVDPRLYRRFPVEFTTANQYWRFLDKYLLANPDISQQTTEKVLKQVYQILSQEHIRQIYMDWAGVSP